MNSKILVSSDKLASLIELEYSKCIGCKLCTKGCPMLDEFSDNPKKLLSQLNKDNSFDIELPYACMLCGYCAEVCPKSVSFRDLFYVFRKQSVKQYNGKLPGSLNTKGVDIHQKLSFSKFFSDSILGKNTETIFFPGCSLLSNNPEMVMSAYSYLREVFSNCGYSNKCCGKPTEFLGKHEKFMSLMESLKSDFNKHGVKTIITGCQNCYTCFKRNAPEFKIISLYEVLGDSGVPDYAKNRFAETKLNAIIHDPCPTRTEDKIHEAVREILNQLGISYDEMSYNKHRTLCCGMGGMVSLTSKKIFEKHRDRRRQEAGSKTIITYCMECAETLQSENLDSIHLLELIFTDVDDIKTEKSSLAKSWFNRYRARKLAGEVINETK